MSISTHFVRVLEEDSVKLLTYCKINSINVARYSIDRANGINTFLYIVKTDICAVTALKLACKLVGITRRPLHKTQ
jgi:hypothetical protein